LIHCLKVISIGLNELGVFRPVAFSVVAEGPGFEEGLTRSNFVSVSEVLFDEASVEDVSLFSSFGVTSEGVLVL